MVQKSFDYEVDASGHKSEQEESDEGKRYKLSLVSRAWQKVYLMDKIGEVMRFGGVKFF